MLNHLRNKCFFYIFAVGLAAGLFSGCSETKIEYSERINTAGTVIQKKHVKKSYLNPMDDINPMRNIDPTFDLKKGRHITKQDEQFNVYIDTKVRRFRVNNKFLFKNVEVNSAIDVSYRERYRSTYEDIDGDGKDDLVKRVLTGYEFVDANPVR